MEVRSVFSRRRASARRSDGAAIRYRLVVLTAIGAVAQLWTPGAAAEQASETRAAPRERSRNDHRHGAATRGRFAGRADSDRHPQRRSARQGGTVPLRRSEPAFPQHEHPVRESAPDQHRGARPRQQPGQRRAGVERRRLSRRRVSRPARHGEPGSHRHRADLAVARPARHVVRQEHDRWRAEHRQPRTDVHAGSATGIIRWPVRRQQLLPVARRGVGSARRGPTRRTIVVREDVPRRLRRRRHQRQHAERHRTQRHARRSAVHADGVVEDPHRRRLQHGRFRLLRVGALQPWP